MKTRKMILWELRKMVKKYVDYKWLLVMVWQETHLHRAFGECISGHASTQTHGHQVTWSRMRPQTFARQPSARGPNRNRRLVNMPFGHERESKQGASRARQDQPQHCKRTTSNVTPLPGQSDKHVNTHPNTHWYSLVHRQAASSLLNTDRISELTVHSVQGVHTGGSEIWG